MIANYISLFVQSNNCPESLFDFQFETYEIQEKFKEFFIKADFDEIVKLLVDLASSEEDLNKLSIVFNYFFSLIHQENSGKLTDQNINVCIAISNF